MIEKKFGVCPQCGRGYIALVIVANQYVLDTHTITISNPVICSGSWQQPESVLTNQPVLNVEFSK